ncbi:MAG: glycosyltransferase [Verrucomicrobia bacterium]|nr:glycosyltransferase [Verrucomicrobiota bacterium]MBT7068565.1 glycosyltransferase [Verrucomicrobiota bacterium]MBT7699567.1 glycosyltransferase [Verrucomicrobiota bacterium]
MKTSLIVNVYNRAAWLEVCLGALLHQRVRPDEVIVADDGSSSEEVAAVKAFLETYPIPHQYAAQQDKGFRAAAARNMGIRLATGEYLFFIDCDIVLMPDALAQHLERAHPGRFLQGQATGLSEATTEPILAGEPLDAAGVEALWGQADISHLGGNLRQFEKNRILRALHLTKRHKPQLISNHFSIHRADMERVNGFDEVYEGWGLEDDDLGMRLYQSGMHVRPVFKEARAVHLYHTTHKPEAAEWVSNNRDYFHRKNVATFCEKGLR